MLSGTAFTAPRAENQSTWLYKLRPSAMHGPYRRIDQCLRAVRRSRDAAEPPALESPPLPTAATDFLGGLITVAGSGDAASQTGIAVHVYRANRSMGERYFWNADGELMFVPQQGALHLETELGRLDVNGREPCRAA